MRSRLGYWLLIILSVSACNQAGNSEGQLPRPGLVDSVPSAPHILIRTPEAKGTSKPNKKVVCTAEITVDKDGPVPSAVILGFQRGKFLLKKGNLKIVGKRGNVISYEGSAAAPTRTGTYKLVLEALYFVKQDPVEGEESKPKVVRFPQQGPDIRVENPK